MQILKCAVAILLAAPIFGSGGNPELPQGLTVHEWGCLLYTSRCV